MRWPLCRQNPRSRQRRGPESTCAPNGVPVGKRVENQNRSAQRQRRVPPLATAGLFGGGGNAVRSGGGRGQRGQIAGAAVGGRGQKTGAHGVVVGFTRVADQFV